MAALDEFLRHGQTGWTGTDHRHFVSRWPRWLVQRESADRLPLLISDKGFKLADTDGRLLAAIRPDRESDRTLPLAEPFLRAESAAHLRECRRFPKDRCR